MKTILRENILKIDLDKLQSKNALKGLNSLIIFSNIDSIFPVEKYDKIDMKLFYEE